jgi:hypothetical protein
MAFFKLLQFLLLYIFQGMLYSWPISLTLVAILVSEIPHAPKQWHRHHLLAFAPLFISLFMILWVVLAVLIPPMRLIAKPLGLTVGQIAMAAEIATAAFAWYRLEGNRCFFLSLMLVELWFGFWTTSIAGMILLLLAHRFTM